LLVDFVKPTGLSRLLRRRFFLQNAQEIGFTSNEVVLLLTNNQHRTRRSAHDTFGCAADGEIFPTRETVRGDHDKIDIELFGCFDDFVRGKSVRIIDFVPATPTTPAESARARKSFSNQPIPLQRTPPLAAPPMSMGFPVQERAAV
jgi:hypothetical protein